MDIERHITSNSGSLLELLKTVDGSVQMTARGRHSMYDVVKRFIKGDMTVLEVHESLIRLFGAENVLDKVTNELIKKVDNHRELCNQLMDICNDFNTIPLGPLANFIITDSVRKSLLSNPLEANSAASTPNLSSPEVSNPPIDFSEQPANPFDDAEHNRQISFTLQHQRHTKDIITGVSESTLVSDPLFKATSRVSWYPIPSFPLGPAWGHAMHVIGDVMITIGGGGVSSPARFDCISIMDLRTFAHRFIPCVGDVPPSRDKYSMSVVRVRPRRGFSEGGIMAVLFGGHETLMANNNVDGSQPSPLRKNENPYEAKSDETVLIGNRGFAFESQQQAINQSTVASNNITLKTTANKNNSSTDNTSSTMNHTPQLKSSNVCYVLDVFAGRWCRLPSTGVCPSPRSGHSMLAIPENASSLSLLDNHDDQDNRHEQEDEDAEDEVYSSVEMANEIKRRRTLRASACGGVGYTRSLLLFGGHEELKPADHPDSHSGGVTRRSVNDLWVLDIEKGWQWSRVKINNTKSVDLSVSHEKKKNKHVSENEDVEKCDKSKHQKETGTEPVIPCARECHSMSWIGRLPSGGVGFCVFGGATFGGNGKKTAREMLLHHGLLPIKGNFNSEEERLAAENTLIEDAVVNLESVPMLLGDAWTCELSFNRDGSVRDAAWLEICPRGVLPSPRASHSAAVTLMAIGDAANDPQNATLSPVLVVIGGQVAESPSSPLASTSTQQPNVINAHQPPLSLIKPPVKHLRNELSSRSTSLVATDSVAVLNFATGLWHSLHPGSGVANPPQLNSTSQPHSSTTSSSIRPFEPRASSGCMTLYLSQSALDTQLPSRYLCSASSKAAWPLGWPLILIHCGFSSQGVLGDATVLSLSGAPVPTSLHGLLTHGLTDALQLSGCPPLAAFSRLADRRNSLARLLASPYIAATPDLSTIPKVMPITAITTPTATNAVTTSGGKQSAIDAANAVAENIDTKQQQLDNSQQQADQVKQEQKTSNSTTITATGEQTTSSTTVPFTSDQSDSKTASTACLVTNKTSLFPQPAPGMNGQSVPQSTLLQMRARSSLRPIRYLPLHTPIDRIWASRKVAARATRPTFHFGLSWQLATSVASPLQAVGLLVDNVREASSSSSASQVSLRGIITGRRFRCLVVEDNGSGLAPPALCKLLNSYGTGEEAATQATTSSPHPVSFGLGFKIGVARLGMGVMVFSKTSDYLSIGMLSAELNASSQSTELATPIVSFPLNSGKPRIRRACIERVLAHHGPFTPAELSMETQRVLDISQPSCTRLVVFGLRSDVDQLAFLQSGNITVAPPHMIQSKALAPPEKLTEHYQQSLRQATLSLPSRYARYYNTTACNELLRFQQQQTALLKTEKTNNNTSSTDGSPPTASPPTEPVGEHSAENNMSNTTTEMEVEQQSQQQTHQQDSPTAPIATPDTNLFSAHCGDANCANPITCQHGRSFLDPPPRIPAIYWTPADILTEYRVTLPPLFPEESHSTATTTDNSDLKEEGKPGSSVPGINVDGTLDLLHVDELRVACDESSSSSAAEDNSKKEASSLESCVLSIRRGSKLGYHPPGYHSLSSSSTSSSCFPMWRKWGDSIDASLKTFLYWRHLFISPSNCDLIIGNNNSNTRNKNKTHVASVKETLASNWPGENAHCKTPFEFLKSKLHGACYLPYLLSPDDTSCDGFLLLGFLNDLEKKPFVQSEAVSETGLLMYVSGRLINRQGQNIPQLRSVLDSYIPNGNEFDELRGYLSTLEKEKQKESDDVNWDVDVSTFPITAIIGMPRYWFASPSGTSFTYEGSTQWSSMMTVIHEMTSEYLKSVVKFGLKKGVQDFEKRRKLIFYQTMAQKLKVNALQEDLKNVIRNEEDEQMLN
eukprot:GDKJ01057273.1.p1 GENE.GDKJ01057273.1~~GDKJ01057273.1.p1  ORF type:complete len:1867 (+),score=434.45 GDKJ01057273.1:56-5656(+)